MSELKSLKGLKGLKGLKIINYVNDKFRKHVNVEIPGSANNEKPKTSN